MEVPAKITLRIIIIAMLCAVICEALPSLIAVKSPSERQSAFRVLPADFIYARKRALDSLDGDDFTLHKRALDVMEGDGFGFEKRKRALDQIEGDDMGFRKRSNFVVAADEGFKHSAAADPAEMRQAVNALAFYHRLGRALDAIEGTSFGF